MPSIVISPIPPQDVAAFSDVEDEESLDANGQGEDREEREIIDAEPVPTSTDETFSQWFGRHDATMVSFYGELRVSDGGDVTELCIGGTPLSELLEPEDLPHYHVFLHDLLRGHAAWQGEELADGTIREGCLAVRRGDVVELTYGSQVSPDNEISLNAESIEHSAPFFPDSRRSEEAREEPALVNLDNVLSQHAGENSEGFEEVAHAA